MARRGTQVREHMLYTAKNVFLEMGFERASMDEIAARAETSKRTLYAHFESKEKLYLEVIGLVRGLMLQRLGTPSHTGGEIVEAVTAFCLRFQAMLVYGPAVRMSRMVLAEAARFPEGAAVYYDAAFDGPRLRLADYLKAECHLTADVAERTAENLLARTMHPRHTRALYGVDRTWEDFAGEGDAPTLESGPVRAMVEGVLAGLR